MHEKEQSLNDIAVNIHGVTKLMDRSREVFETNATKVMAFSKKKYRIYAERYRKNFMPPESWREKEQKNTDTGGRQTHKNSFLITPEKFEKNINQRIARKEEEQANEYMANLNALLKNKNDQKNNTDLDYEAMTTKSKFGLNFLKGLVSIHSKKQTDEDQPDNIYNSPYDSMEDLDKKKNFE